MKLNKDIIHLSYIGLSAVWFLPSDAFCGCNGISARGRSPPFFPAGRLYGSVWKSVRLPETNYMEQRIMPIYDRFGYVASVSGIKISQLLGPIYASNVFGAIARMIGPHLSVSRVADQNLHAAMSELSYAERCQIIRLVWENLGRTIGEFPHLSKLDSTSSGPGFEISGSEHLCDLGEGPVIFVSAHIGNWEAFPPIAARNVVVASSIYRAASNPLIDRLTLGLRRAGVRTHLPRARTS